MAVSSKEHHMFFILGVIDGDFVKIALKEAFHDQYINGITHFNNEFWTMSHDKTLKRIRIN